MGRKLQAETIDAITAAGLGGESIRSIAVRLHADRETVATILKKAGVATRRARQSGAFNPSSTGRNDSVEDTRQGGEGAIGANQPDDVRPRTENIPPSTATPELHPASGWSWSLGAQAREMAPEEVERIRSEIGLTSIWPVTLSISVVRRLVRVVAADVQRTDGVLRLGVMRWDGRVLNRPADLAAVVSEIEAVLRSTRSR